MSTIYPHRQPASLSKYPRLNVREFGAKGDGHTDDTDAIERALAALSHSEEEGGPDGHPFADRNFPCAGTVYLPPGEYLVTRPIVLRRCVVLEGTAGAGDWSATYLWIRNNGSSGSRIDGIVADMDYSSESIPLKKDASFSQIRNLLIQAHPDQDHLPGLSMLGHGIRIHAHGVLVQNVVVSGMGGNGIHIEADHRDGKNANGWRIDNCRLTFCQNGLFVTGRDANAGLCTGVDVSSNRECGMWDANGLGNTYVGCHEADNGTMVDGVYSGASYRVRSESGEAVPSNESTFVGCYEELPPRFDMAASGAIVVGGYLGHHIGSASLKAPGTRISQTGSKLKFLQFHNDGDSGGPLARTYAEIPVAEEQSPIVMGYHEPTVILPDGTQSYLEDNWQIKRHINPTFRTNRTWTICQNRDSNLAPFGWTGRTHPKGPGHPFILNPMLNTEFNFIVPADVNWVENASPVPVVLAGGSERSIQFSYTDLITVDGRGMFCTFSVALVDSPSLHNPSVAALPSDATEIGPYQISATGCTVKIRNNAAVDLSIIVWGHFQQHEDAGRLRT